MPEGMEYLLGWFNEVCPQSAELTYQEIESFNRLTHKNLAIWEIDVLRSLGRIKNGR